MIAARQLAFAHRGGAAIAFPDLDVPAGATLLLHGPSGSGKSTLIALLAGLLRPVAGTLVVAGTGLHALGPAACDAWRGATVGLLPQRLHLASALSVADNLALAYYAAGLPRDGAAIDRALNRLGIAHLAGRLPRQLSGGEAQRVALARAVLRGPRVLLADEPTASLDDASCADALALLRDTAAATGATLVLATHDARARQAPWGADVCQIGLQAAPRLPGQLCIP